MHVFEIVIRRHVVEQHHAAQCAAVAVIELLLSLPCGDRVDLEERGHVLADFPVDLIE